MAIFFECLILGRRSNELKKAVTCLSDLALTAMGMDRIILIAHLENKASIRVAEKSGFKLVSRF